MSLEVLHGIAVAVGNGTGHSGVKYGNRGKGGRGIPSYEIFEDIFIHGALLVESVCWLLPTPRATDKKREWASMATGGIKQCRTTTSELDFIFLVPDSGCLDTAIPNTRGRPDL